jgi:phosphatidate cytidylyltransferase
MDSNLVRRIAFAAVAIPLAILIVWVGGWPFALLVATIAWLGSSELFDLARRHEVAAIRPVGLALAAALPLLAYLQLVHVPTADFLRDWSAYLVPAFVMVLLSIALAVRPATARPLGAVAVTLFGVAYTSVLPGFLVLIRHGVWPVRSWGGTALVFFPLVVVWICDTAAMFGGRAVGGAKMAPSISPGKTRSGGIAGLIGGVAVAPLFSLVVFPRVGIELPLMTAMLMALAFSVIGQVGDLAESLLKREAGVKDSSSLIPGHGGVLDRFDSLYFVIPVAAACYRLVGLL